MKKLTTLFAALSIVLTLQAQAPEKISYQAVIRNSTNALVINHAIGMKVSILQTSATGTVVYAETHTPTTNINGVVTITIGTGNVVSGTFAGINWAAGPYFIKTETDPAGGTAYTITSTSELLSVPYALYASKAANGFSGNYNDLTNKPVIINNTRYSTAVGSDALINTTIGNFNVAVGREALYSNKLGACNTAVGTFCLYKNTNGDYNTAIGFGSLTNDTLGSLNTGLGAYSLYSNTTGSGNSALGYNALKSNTTGIDNVALGIISLSANTIGSNNTAMGTKSLSANTTGSENTAIGSSALYANVTGRWNVALGSYALSSSLSDKNTAIGFEALKATTFWDNTAVGYQAMLANTEGFDNVAMGVNALAANTNGDGNTAIGKNAMSGNSTGNNNTAVGFNANVSGNVSNSTAIGNGATVNAGNKIVIGNASATTIGGYGAWTNYSDIRLKENIHYTNSLGLDFILKLKTATYNYKEDTNKRQRDGLIAQDVQQTLSELGLNFSGLVTDDDKEKTLNLSYSDFVLPLINAVKELYQRNLQLEKTVEDLKIRLDNK